MKIQIIALLGVVLALLGWFMLSPFSEFRRAGNAMGAGLGAFWDGWSRFFAHLTLSGASAPRARHTLRPPQHGLSRFIAEAFSGDFAAHGTSRQA